MGRVFFTSLFLFGIFAHADTPAIGNFHQVTSLIFRGGRPTTDADFQGLASLGVKQIINLQGGDYSENPILGYAVPFFEQGEKPSEIAAENATALANGMEMIPLPLNSLKTITKPEALEIEFALKTLSAATSPIFIHCAHGADRTGLVIALYRMKCQKWTKESAHDEMYAMGHTTSSLLVTWPMDMYFYQYANWLKSHPNVDCAGT
jgi:protein tyrosine/serine phosphatase